MEKCRSGFERTAGSPGCASFAPAQFFQRAPSLGTLPQFFFRIRNCRRFILLAPIVCRVRYANLFLPLLFSGHCFGLIPASGSLASSAFPVPPLHHFGFPPIKQPLALEAEATRFWVPQENGARKRRNFSYVLPICRADSLADA
jgi:hypothetical protein